MIGPTKYSSALMASVASQTGTGTIAPFASLTEKHDVNTYYKAQHVLLHYVNFHLFKLVPENGPRLISELFRSSMSEVGDGKSWYS